MKIMAAKSQLLASLYVLLLHEWQMAGTLHWDLGLGRGFPEVNRLLPEAFCFLGWSPASLGMLLPGPLSSDAPALWVLCVAGQWDCVLRC